MTRTLTDPNSDDILEWTERVTDPDGHFPSITLKLDAIDDGNGYTAQGTLATNVSWLSYSTTQNTLGGGEAEVLVNIDADSTSLTAGYSYRFELIADDGFTTTSRKFVLSILAPSVPTVDGTVIFTISNDNIIQYDLSTGWEPSTATYIQTVSPPISDPRGISISADGNWIFLSDFFDTKVRKYPLNTAWDITTIGSLAQSFTTSVPYRPQGLSIRNNGKAIYAVDQSTVSLLTLTTAYDLSTATEQTTTLSSPGVIRGIDEKQDGTKLFVADTDTFKIYQYSFGTAGDLSTLSEDKGIDPPQGNGPNALNFRSNGERMLVSDTSGTDEILRFDLTSPWDIGTASVVSQTDISTNSPGATDMTVGM